MKLVSENINEMGIKHLSPKSEEDIANYLLSHPKEAMQHVILNDDVINFVKLLKEGIKFGIGHARTLYNHHRIYVHSKDNDLKKLTYKSKILRWLKENLNDLSKYNISEKFLKQLKQALNAGFEKRINPRTYPKGYKQWRVLKALKDNNGMTSDQIVQLIFELGYGPNSYNPIINYSYWSEGVGSIIYPWTTYPAFSNEHKTDDIIYLSKGGEIKLEKLNKRFLKLNINALV